MKKLLIVLFIVSLFISCSQKNEKSSVILNGKIENKKSNEIGIFLFDNFITRDIKTITSPINDDGEFNLILEIDHPQYVLLSRPRSNHPLFLYPGDSLYITFDDKNTLQTLSFQGNGSERNNLLNDYMKKYSMNNFFTMMREKDISGFKNHLLSVNQEANEFYNNAFLEHKLKKEFTSYLKAQIKYEFYMMMFMQKGMYMYANKIPRDSLKLPEKYYDFVNENDFNDDSAIINADIYLNAMSHYIRYKLQGIKFDSYDQYFNEMYNYSKENLKNKTRDYFIGKEITNKITMTNSINDSIFQDYLNICKSPDVKKIVQAVYQNNISIQELVDSPFPENILDSQVITQKNDQILFKDMLEKYKGKIIFIDIWSLSCGPCRAELPHSRELIKKYKNEDISFIFLSLDQTNEIWNQGIELSKITEGHYRLDKGFDSELLKTLNIKGIPRYLIVDRNGNIKDLDSKRPSSEDLIIELDNLLDA